jgi:hypothetical protein
MQRNVILQSLLRYRYKSDLRKAQRDLFNQDRPESIWNTHTAVQTVLQTLKDNAISLPKASTFDALYLDGYPHAYVSQAVTTVSNDCVLRSICFYPEVGWDLVDWITSRNQDCGDCLLPKSKFLTAGLQDNMPIRGDSRYSTVVEQIKRYSYAITKTELEFVNLKSVSTIREQLQCATTSKAAQLCINDDLSDTLGASEILYADTAIRTFLSESFDDFIDKNGRHM